MQGSSFPGVSGQGKGQVVDMGTGYLLTFKRRMKLYDANPDKYRFYAPYILIDFLNPKKAGRPFHDDAKTVKEILKEEVRRYGRYHAFLDDYINKHSDPLVDFSDEETARYHLKLIRDLLIESQGEG
jgi:hypothetical protein